MPNLEDVFRLSGVPTYTFVQPDRYDEIKVSMRTPGRCMIVEGPSGIGKTTTVTKVLDELALTPNVMSLSARRPADQEMIQALPDMDRIGTVIVDDFHRLDDALKLRLSDYMKVLADAADASSKLILGGINKAGQQLVKFAHDVGLRMDTFRLEANPTELVEELIRRGESALNVQIPQTKEVAERAQGSFQIAQLLCHKICILDRITESQAARTLTKTSLDVALEDVMLELARQFKDATITFARGSKLRPEGRAPYLHLLKWLSESDEWSLDVREAMVQHPDMRGSVGQVIEKRWLEALLQDPDKQRVLAPYFHFEPSTAVLSVEDPKLIFYLKNIVWRVFTRQAGYRADYFKGRYDVALSFAGANRDLAAKLSTVLIDREVQVFYDFNEQHRIMAQNVEDYLAPIYRSEARYVVVFQSPDYPTRIWTKVESDAFKERFGQGAIIAVRFTSLVPGFFSEEARYGGLPFDPAADEDTQIDYIADMICRRLVEDKETARRAEEVESTGVAPETAASDT